MTKTEKTEAIERLKSKFAEHSFFYVTDSSALTVGEVNDLRRECFNNGVELRVVKNTLAQKALETFSEDKMFTPLFEVLKGPSAFMFAESANVPAKIIEKFRKTHEKPVLKAAYIDTDVFIGDEHVSSLAKLKSKEELIGEVITLLGSPIKNVLSMLDSGGNTLNGLLQALEDKGE